MPVISSTMLLLGATYLWSKLRPELIYAILQGYTPQEIKIVNGLSYRDTILYWGFETASLLALSNLILGLTFSLVLAQSQLISTHQHWLALCCLLAFTTTPDIPASISFWKRWFIYLGGIYPLFSSLAQLSLAVFIFLLLLSNRKKHLVLSSTLAGIVLVILNPLSYLDSILILSTCLVTSTGITYSGVKPIMIAAFQYIPVTRKDS